jgi:hypothetical protein
MAKPKRGSVERWSLKNGSGGWVRHSRKPQYLSYQRANIVCRPTPFTSTLLTSRL